MGLATSWSLDEVAIGDLEALYDAYHRQALGVAFAVLHSLEDAEEVVQEAFIAAWRAAATFDSTRGSPRTWLFALVRNRAIDELRARGRRRTHACEEVPEGVADANPATDAIRSLEAVQVRLALEALPGDQQQVLRLAHFEGLSHSEIATRLGLPLGTVKSRIRLALDRLRPALHALSADLPNETSGPVLVVDDDPTMRRLIGRALEDEGFRVLKAVDGRQALEQAGRQRLALVVLDLLLPRLDGEQVATALRATGQPTIPILMISVDRQLPEKARRIGACAYLPKPFELDDLVSSVRSGIAAAVAS